MAVACLIRSQASPWTSPPRSALEVAMILSCRWPGTSS
jgi:hypothetical protein